MNDDGEDKPIAFVSKGTNKHQKNYSTTDLECPAVAFALEKFKHYVFGVEFELYTDHLAILNLLNKSELKGKYARWALELANYNMKVFFRKGKENVVADALSRHPLESYAVELSKITSEPSDISDKFGAIRFYLKNGYLPSSWPADKIRYYKKEARHFCLVDGALCKRKKNGLFVQVILGKEAQRALLVEFHEGRAHFGVTVTFQSLQDLYFWPRMFEDVRDFVRC